MKISKTIICAVLMVLTCVGFISCSDDDKDDEPQIDNELIGTWLWDDGVKSESYEFSKSGYVSYNCWAVDDPYNYDYYDYDFADYKYDEPNGLLQLFWNDGSVDRWEIEIKGDRMYVKKADSDYSETRVLYRKK